ncbi:hypothetical protein J8281_16595 [Aquimarina sp. U1-2]|uniref:hypothetical protein n=1 Tax=Aquimarina sp. U1-2 TaxID=2823141 RepID=UPI001AECE451|nr:hypothetical protein [Aquimarina sp. U1-2]MBP2833816.1 hypothetical protein [Aquimarina sp. U1-2]
MKNLFLLLLLFSSIILRSQDEALAKHASFFDSRIPELNDWLSSNNIPDSLLQAKGIVVDDNELRVLMEVKDKSNWASLNEKTKTINGKKFNKELFEKITFLMEVEKTQLNLEIEGIDTFITLKSNDSSVEEDYMDKMGEISDNHKIPIGDLSNINLSDNTTSKIPIDELKERLEKHLKKHFEKYKAKFEDYQFKTISKLNNELIINISNVVDVILEEGYFEYIRIYFEFEELEKDINVSYRIGAKYGSGIIWSPKNSDYKDMDPKYIENLKDFNLKIKNLINDILTK